MEPPGGNGKYVLDRRLGGGGMAEVFLGHAVGAEGFRKPVAIKRVLPAYSDDAAFAEMFVAEARLSAQLQHPNIVTVLDFDRDPEGRLFLVMEHVDGANLDALVAAGELPVPAAIHIAAEMLRGLGHAHDASVVHRDVSPHNVLIGWTGEVKVSDFGIAKALASTSGTASNVLKGKPAYMSPEQANGGELDGRSDLFSVGVVLWEMLCGRALFAGQTTEETLARLLFSPIPAPRELRREVGADVERVVMRLLARDRGERYSTAQAALADLVACADYPRAGRDLVGAQLVERLRQGTPVERRHRGAPRSTLVDPSARRRRRTVAIAAGLGVAATIGVVWIATRSNSSTAKLAPDAFVEPAMIDDPEALQAAVGRTVQEGIERAPCAPGTDSAGDDTNIMGYVTPDGILDKVAFVPASPYTECLERTLKALRYPRSHIGADFTTSLARGASPPLPELPDDRAIQALVNSAIRVAGCTPEQGHYSIAGHINSDGVIDRLSIIPMNAFTACLEPALRAVPYPKSQLGHEFTTEVFQSGTTAAPADASAAVDAAPKTTAKKRLGPWPDLKLLPKVTTIPEEPSFDVAIAVVDAAVARAKIACESPSESDYTLSLEIDSDGAAAGISVSPGSSAYASCLWEILNTGRYPRSKRGALWTGIRVKPD